MPGSNGEELLILVNTRLSVWNRTTKTETVLAANIQGTDELVVDPVRGEAILADNRGLYAVDLATGVERVITENDDSVGSGIPFFNLDELAVDPVAGIAYARESTEDEVMAIDLETGERTLVASEFHGAGLPFFDEGGLAVSRDGRTLYVWDEELEAILGVSIATGDRVMVSR